MPTAANGATLAVPKIQPARTELKLTSGEGLLPKPLYSIDPAKNADSNS